MVAIQTQQHQIGIKLVRKVLDRYGPDRHKAI